jgi:hypothetical protein
MTYITPKRRFIDSAIGDGLDPDDAQFVADLMFLDDETVRPGSIMDVYKTQEH